MRTALRKHVRATESVWTRPTEEQRPFFVIGRNSDKHSALHPNLESTALKHHGNCREGKYSSANVWMDLSCPAHKNTVWFSVYGAEGMFTLLQEGYEGWGWIYLAFYWNVSYINNCKREILCFTIYNTKHKSVERCTCQVLPNCRLRLPVIATCVHKEGEKGQSLEDSLYDSVIFSSIVVILYMYIFTVYISWLCYIQIHGVE